MKQVSENTAHYEMNVTDRMQANKDDDFIGYEGEAQALLNDFKEEHCKEMADDEKLSLANTYALLAVVNQLKEIDISLQQLVDSKV